MQQWSSRLIFYFLLSYMRVEIQPVFKDAPESVKLLCARPTRNIWRYLTAKIASMNVQVFTSILLMFVK